MQVKEVLYLDEMERAEVIAGHKGLHRYVKYVEVMEVPEVSNWVTPGILVMTTFYSIKENPDKQIKVMKELIAKQAAGLVIKLGRFVKELPEEVIELANENDFPVIRMPKDVSYIKVLTPLHERLFHEKRKNQNLLLNPLLKLEHTNFASLPDALDKLSEIVNSHVYIEDLEGRLLYVSNDFSPDGWRSKTTLFSLPDYTSYPDVIHSWKKNFLKKGYAQFKISGYRNRLLLPLFSQDEVFAVLHILYTKELNIESTNGNGLSGVSQKISTLFLSDQLYLQRSRLNDMKHIEQIQVDALNYEKTIVYFEAPWMKNIVNSSSHLIDYSSLIRKKLNNFMEPLSTMEKVFLERNNKFYVILYGDELSYSDIIMQLSRIVDGYNKREGKGQIRVAVSPKLHGSASLSDQLATVQKTMEIGKKIKPDETIYTFDKLGIYEVLLKLINDHFSMTYVNNILHPLEKDDGILLETLRVYLNQNGNVSRTAELLFIHRRTLTYRIQKIEELLNMDLNDSMNRFILRFCLLLKELS